MSSYDDSNKISGYDGAMNDTKSKSQIKREMKDLHTLGEELVNLNKNQLAELPLDSSLQEAITLAQNIKAHGGRKRQLKFIGKLLRNSNADAILHSIQLRQEKERRATARFHHIERWRDRLLEEGDTALEELLKEYPRIDRQQIRILIRNSKKENSADKPPVATRNLFRFLRNLMNSAE